MMHYHSYYKSFDEEQFAADEYFQQWVLSADNATDEFWQSYVNLYPAQKDAVQKAREVVQELAGNDYNLQHLTIEEKAELKKGIFDRLQIEEEVPVVSYKRKNYTWLAAAAVVIVIATSALFLFLKPVKEKAAPQLVQVNSTEDRQEIML